MINPNIQILQSKPLQKKDFNKLKQFLIDQGMPSSVQIPQDFKKILSHHRVIEYILLKTTDELKYVQIGAGSADDLINNLNGNVEFISFPALVIGINGMGQSLLYVYKNKKLELYIATDGNFGDDPDELIFLSTSLTSFLTNKDNLQYLE